jgi:hypothetical protein
MKKIITLLFGLTLLGTVQLASAAYDFNQVTGTIKKLSTCDNDNDAGKVILWVEDSSGTITVFGTGSATPDTDESQVRKNIYSTALAAYLAKESIEVLYTADGPGTYCEVSYDHIFRGISIGTL